MNNYQEVAAPRLLTSEDVQQKLHITKQTLCKWVRTGKIPAIRLPNGHYRFNSTEITAWLESHTPFSLPKTTAIPEWNAMDGFVWDSFTLRKTPDDSGCPEYEVAKAKKQGRAR